MIVVFLIILHFVIGFVYSAMMARHLEQDSDNDIFCNFLIWELVIVLRTIVMLWRLLAGDSPSTKKKAHYIWSRW